MRSHDRSPHSYGRRSGKRAITLGSAVKDPSQIRGRSGNPVEDIRMFLAQLRMLGMLAFLALQSDSGGGDGDDGDGDPGGDDQGRSGDSGDSHGDSGFRAPKDQDELDRMIRRRLAKAKTDAETAARAAWDQEQQTKEAKDKDDVRKLLKLAEDKAAKLEEDLQRERQGNLRSRIASKHKLPDDLAELLTGETEEELTEHAKRLAKYAVARGDGEEGDDEGDTSKDDIENDAGARGSRKRANQKPVPQFRVASTVKTVKMPGA
jgi:hypothetical protein